MMGSFLAGLFGCSHRRLTRPITPTRKPGEPSGETYVVCLACGKQFAYDWNHMRIGDPIPRSSDEGVLPPNTPAPNNKLKYALLGSAIPVAMLLGGLLASKRRSKTPVDATPERPRETLRADAPYISLPHGGPGARFSVAEIIDYIAASGRDYIIVGQVDCALADHPRPRSLDYWLREKFARNKETKQATPEVVQALLATGRFEAVDQLRCPDTGDKSYALRVRPAATGV